jgi:hypothetical protein
MMAFGDLVGGLIAGIVVLIFLAIVIGLGALYYGAILYILLSVLKWFGIIHLAAML